MKPQEHSHSIDLLFVLLIFAAFVITAMLLISMETSEYQRIIGRMQDNDLSRVTTAYLTQKVRQGREAEAITAEDFHGIPSLCIRSRIAGGQYEINTFNYFGVVIIPESFAFLISYSQNFHVFFLSVRKLLMSVAVLTPASETFFLASSLISVIRGIVPTTLSASQSICNISSYDKGPSPALRMIPVWLCSSPSKG